MRQRITYQLLLCFSVLGIVSMTSCNKDPDINKRTIIDFTTLTFNLNEQKQPEWRDQLPLSSQKFNELYVNKIWGHTYAQEIYVVEKQAVVTLDPRADFWRTAKIIPSVFQLEEKNIKIYVYNSESKKYILNETKPYTYNEKDNAVYVDGKRFLQIYNDQYKNDSSQLLAIETYAAKGELEQYLWSDFIELKGDDLKKLQ